MNIIVITKKGRIIKFDSKDFPKQFRGGIGVKAITLKDHDEVAGIVSEKVND